MKDSFKVSIIIPVLNEEESLSRLILYLLKHTKGESTEIIISDGGSEDKTIEIANNYNIKIWKAPEKGRAKQMNFGATKAGGEILYFLHSDTIPPKKFIELIRKEIQSKNKAGCFRLSFDWRHPALRFYEWFTSFDIDLFRFGDQSLFVEKALFQNIGGYREDLLVMEDQEIITRIKKHAQFSIIKTPVITSARKYQRFGVFRLQLIFSIIVVLFYLKISQEVIANFYKTFLRNGSD